MLRLVSLVTDIPKREPLWGRMSGFLGLDGRSNMPPVSGSLFPGD